MMRAARDDRRLLGLPALALAPATGSLSAAAQSGSEAVVCVGSETRTLATNPIRRVYTEDMEVVYRTGVDIGQRAQVERALSSELGSYPEVWCAWSDPGDDHAVIVGYTGVIRQDMTVDPEDPRFQAFGVGFGTDFDAAEAQATTINQRFSSRNHGSGYGVLLRERWSVAAAVAAEVSAPEPNLPEGRICTEVYSPDSGWMELAHLPGCYLWNPNPRESVTVTWSRGCSNGLAQGNGRVQWYQNDELIQIWETRLQGGRPDGPFRQRSGDGGLEAEGRQVNGERSGTWTFFYEGRDDDLVRRIGPYVDGEPHGTWTEFYDDGDRAEGPYVNGERHGTWTIYDPSGNQSESVRFEDGRRVGGSGSAVEAGVVPTVTSLQVASRRLGRLQGLCLDADASARNRGARFERGTMRGWEEYNRAARAVSSPHARVRAARVGYSARSRSLCAGPATQPSSPFYSRSTHPDILRANDRSQR